MTYQFKRIAKSIDEESLLGLKRKPRVERELPVKTGSSRFPDFSDGRPCLGFATLTHGSIRTWSQLRSAQGHNTRTISGPNIRKDAPAPIELLSEATGSYQDRVKRILDDHGVPHKVRANGCLATEDIYGASPEYWNRDGDWKTKDPSEIARDPVVQLAVAVARKRHGATLVSCELHLDEASPHVHVVAVPLVQREHRRRGRKPKSCARDDDGIVVDDRDTVLKWSLNWSELRGRRAHMEVAHDKWAEAVAPYGLARGSKGSELSEDDRRSRRQLQTGRASEGGKLIRQERERILGEAEARAVEIEDCARAKAELLDVEIDALFNLVEDRENGLEARERDLDTRQAKLEEIENSLEERRLALEESVNEQEALAAANRELAVSLRAFDERVKKDDEAALCLAEKANLALDRMRQATAFLASASKPDGERSLVSIAGAATPCLEDGETPVWWTDMNDEMKAEFRNCFDEILRVAALRARNDEEAGKLDAAWRSYEAAAEAAGRWCARAEEFGRAWRSIPVAERLPQIQDTLLKSEGVDLATQAEAFRATRPGQGR